MNQTPDLLRQLAHDPAGAEDYDPNAMSVSQARQYIQQFLTPVQQTERLSIKQALGRVLASPIASTLNVPGHNNSAMDGFAFRLAEASQPLRIVGTAFAGKPFNGTIPAGGCIKIMTGAVIPADADTVVMQEHATVTGEHVSIQKLPGKGANIRLLGEDIAIGQTVLATGHTLQPADMGLLASLGVA